MQRRLPGIVPVIAMHAQRAFLPTAPDSLIGFVSLVGCALIAEASGKCMGAMENIFFFSVGGGELERYLLGLGAAGIDERGRCLVQKDSYRYDWIDGISEKKVNTEICDRRCIKDFSI